MRKIKVFVVLIFLSNVVFSQTELKLELDSQLFILQGGINPSVSSFNFQTELFDSSAIRNAYFPLLGKDQFIFRPGEHVIGKRLLLKQIKGANSFPTLGGYEHFKNSFSYKANDKITLNASFGLVKQNSNLSAYNPNYQFSFGSSIEYAITDWLSAYLYGQYLTPSVIEGKEFFDPLLYMNPIFIQSEIGSGLSAKYKNLKLDVGVKKMFDTQTKQVNPVGSMDSKLIIGF